MVSVIIPVLNEERTIAGVVKKALVCESVTEVIVVDDASFDATAEIAAKAGARVVQSTKLGKGASMLDGLYCAKNEIIVYLDGDIENYEDDIVFKMVAPIISEQADFVKSRFSREAGRVTELVAKPLLSLIFPELSIYSQPLSGMIAGRKEMFKKVSFENDYGVDIGILIDMYELGARINEVDIGHIEHKSKHWQQLGKMSREVSRAILKRARNKLNFNLDDLGAFSVVSEQLDNSIRECVKTLEKIVIFDMDNTLLEGRVIMQLADRFGFRDKIIDVVSENSDPYIITKLIAKNLKGLNIGDILSVIESIPIVSDAKEVIDELKKRGYIVGIISDSYDVAVNSLKNKLNLDFALANKLEFVNSVANGEVSIPLAFVRSSESRCNHSICKGNAMMAIAAKYGVALDNVLAVGDGENDICMLRNVGVGVAFCASNPLLKSIADFVIDEKSFARLLEFAN